MIILNSFTYVGPNRRSNNPVQEVSFVLTQAEHAQLGVVYLSLSATLAELNKRLGIQLVLTPQNWEAQQQVQSLANLFAAQALLLQAAAGHLVGEQGLAFDDRLADAQCYFEYDDADTALAVVDFCRDLFSALLGSGDASALTHMLAEFEPRLRQLIDEARPRATPADTRAILEAASFRDIPWLRLEKTGYEFHDGDFRLRKNSLLNLGFGCNRTMIDATFCVDRSSVCFELINDRERLLAALAPLDIPQPRRDPELGSRNSVTRIARAAERIGYPVSIKTSRRHEGLDSVHQLASRSELEAAAERLLAVERSVLVESCVAGVEYRIFVANTRLQAVLRAEQDLRQGRVWLNEPALIHADILAIVGKIANYFPVGIIEIRMILGNISRSIDEQMAAVVDVKLAPRLDDLAEVHPDLLKRIALAFIDWIYPDPTAARIPIIAVTGTNGKTSTSRMIDSVFCLAGHRTGLTCTDGFYVAGKMINEGDFAGFPGHLSVLNSKNVEVAVLETARGGVVQLGLGFDRCDVGVCLNVSEDHLGQFGIHTLEDMARVKFSVVSRASKAVVLNADNPPTLLMKNRLQGRKICLVSTVQLADSLAAAYADVSCFAVVEQREGREWMVIYDQGESVPVIPVAEAPVTFNGSARHYLSNALHAAAACYLAGISPELIRTALAGFTLSYEMTPGRLNVHKGRGITVIMDFAQNPDSLRELVEFVEALVIGGRRLIGLSCSATNTEELIRATAAQAAGKFDHYVCKNFKYSDKRPDDEVPRLLSEGLMARGVQSAVITQVNDPMGAVEILLDMAREGDLVVLMTGRVHREETWKLVTERLS